MALDQTQHQTTDEQRRAQALSLNQLQPPLQLPGYEFRRFLGAGAYGEVWVAVDRNTGRQVAIKFYAHRGGLDWSLLSREVEKLAFLSADRYVVQLLDVGWDADPPFYVMEYVEQGSLEDLLRRRGSKLAASEAVVLFHDIALGLLHAHAKGVLHCDLKPANVLVDQDQKPRLADFGQSRLSHEQTPALGTLFYMAPEQADLEAVPDVRWDVYALGALFYCMLTGEPPHRTAEAVGALEGVRQLEDRLARYRQLIEQSPAPKAHYNVPGVDRALAEIIDRCLAADRNARYANIQAVLDAVQAREQRRAKWPLLVLGAVSPALVLVVMSLFAWAGVEAVVRQSDEALRRRALDSNRFAAQFVAKTVTNELDSRYRAVEEMAASPRFQRLVEATLADEDLSKLRAQLSDPTMPEDQLEEIRKKFVAHPARKPLEDRLTELMADKDEPTVASWFFADAQGLQLGRAPDGPTIGRNYAWRTYFHGGDKELPVDWRPKDGEHLNHTHLSMVFRSQATNRWIVAISTPVIKEDGTFLGVIALAREVGHFIELRGGDEQFAVLVDWRQSPNKGLVLQHPLFDKLADEHGKLPDRFKDYRVEPDDLPVRGRATTENYVDPISADPEGQELKKRWLAEMAPVKLRDDPTGWVVIVQEPYEAAIGRTLSQLKKSLWLRGLLAMALVAILSSALWGFVIRVLRDSAGGNGRLDQT